MLKMQIIANFTHEIILQSIQMTKKIEQHVTDSQGNLQNRNISSDIESKFENKKTKQV